MKHTHRLALILLTWLINGLTRIQNLQRWLKSYRGKSRILKMSIGMNVVTIIILVIIFQWMGNLNEVPTHFTCDQLNSSWQRYAGHWATITCPLEEVYNYEGKMLFLNFVPFQYGDRLSYTSFSGVSWSVALEECLNQYVGKTVDIWGQISGYMHSGQVFIYSCEDVKESTWITK